jgi:protein AbiQ
VFTLDGKLTFINIDQNYLKKLHDVCSEVYYKESGYESKPYIGILVNNNGKKYVIPLSSAEEGDKVKHILSVMDIKKMIPIIEGTYSRVNINPDNNDTDEVKKYKDLLNKEYVFCLKIIPEVIGKANKMYDKQMVTGKIARFCCDFKGLERAAAAMQNENVGK